MSLPLKVMLLLCLNSLQAGKPVISRSPVTRGRGARREPWGPQLPALSPLRASVRFIRATPQSTQIPTHPSSGPGATVPHSSLPHACTCFSEGDSTAQWLGTCTLETEGPGSQLVSITYYQGLHFPIYKMGVGVITSPIL